MEEEEGKTTPHGTETVGWLAIEPGTGNWSGHLFEATITPDAVKQGWYSISFGQSFSAAPRFLAALASYDSAESAHLRYRRTYLTATGAQVRVEEDTVFDSEQIHTTETVAYLAIEGDGELTAQGGSSPASSTYYETQGGAMAVRRVGYPADNGIFYILSDHLGSTSLILAQDGTVVKQDYYYPYGGNRGTPYSEVTTRRFTGQYHEAGLPGGEGLSFYNARWYDPQLGRFISADTIVPVPFEPQSLNRFSYTLGNPINYSDPTGHNPMWCNDPYDGGGGPECAPLVRLGVQPGAKTSWTFKEKSLVWKAASLIDFRFMRRGASFLKVYGGTVLFEKTGISARNLGEATSKRKIIVNEHFDGVTIAGARTGAWWAVHELGHTFNYALAPNTIDGRNAGQGVIDLAVSKIYADVNGRSTLIAGGSTITTYEI